MGRPCVRPLSSALLHLRPPKHQRYYIGARVDGEIAEGAIDFHVLPADGSALRDQYDVASEATGLRVDWAHLCLKWPQSESGAAPYWIEDISEYCPLL